MPYCHQCGTEIEEEARFCYHCGAPVASHNQPTVIYRRHSTGRNPFAIAAIVIAALILSAVIITALTFAPLYPVNASKTSEISQPNINSLNLDFQADVSDVHVYTSLTDKAFLVNVTETGYTSIFGSSEPVKLTVENSTTNSALTVMARVKISGLPSATAHVTTNIYVNPTANLVLNLRSDVGTVGMTADSSSKIQALNLQTTTGRTELSVEKGSAINGNVSLQTGTGTVSLSINQADINGNVSVNLHSTTGQVNINAAETQKFNGNLQIDATTQTGTVNLDSLVIDGDVGARIESHTSLGRRTLDVQHFSGSQSPIQTDNYPTSSNIRLNMKTTTGDIHIHASYKTETTPTSRN